MKFAATPAAIAHAERRGEPLKAIANWTLRSGRYRKPTAQEAAQSLVGPDVTVVRDEGLLFVRRNEEITVHTLEELTDA